MALTESKYVRRWVIRATAALCVSAGALIGLRALIRPAFAVETAPAGDTSVAQSPDEVKFFDEQVKPLLAANCIKCHGGEAKIKGGLRLTTRDSILKGGDDGLIIAPDAPEKSLLISAINYGGEIKMPPDSKLPPEKIAILTKWVQHGVAWTPGLDLTPANIVAAPASGRPDPPTPEAARKSFWAFQPVKKPDAPVVKDTAWVRNPVDAFVLAKLEAKGLHPAPPADKISLLRRATYDLTGLPPTPAEVDAFLNNPARDAYEKVVDRLLDSPHYGEKWGRYWLDLVRYGESNSYERDNPKPNVWRYRDYVIRSINADKPYDQFVKEQLAGDEMPDAKTSFDPIIATGFYRLGIWDDEPNDRLQAHYDNLDDIVTTTGQVFMGLTIDCARCHNHKIDPILQTDYYRMLAFFQNIRPFANGGQGDEVELFNTPSGREAYEAEIAKNASEADALQARAGEIETEFRKLYLGGKSDVRQADLEELHYRYYRDSWEKLPDFDSLKFETEGAVPAGLFDISLRTRDTAFGFVFTGTLIVPSDGNYTFYLDSDDGSRLSIDGKLVIDYDGIHGEGQEHHVTVPLLKGRRTIRLEYFQNLAGLGLTVGWSGPGFERRALSAPPVDKTKPRRIPRSNVGRLILDEGEKVLGHERFADYQRIRQQLEEMRRAPAHDRALCVTEAGTKAPDTYVCLRGNANVPGEIVQPGFPKVLADGDAMIPPPSADAATTGRRTVLANWITSDANPLFTRVMANRVFQYHFGRGIVRSPNNFGVQGDRPTHPELLDWLASSFKENGLHLKPLHRLIMTSNAYRMSSQADGPGLNADPQNDLLWHFDLRRLTAEEVRDTILEVDGKLNFKMYGPSVYPDIPAAVKATESIAGRNWDTSTAEEAARRSVYVHVKRSLALPILQAFDAAETDRSCPVRFVTVQPTQALGMLNGEFINKEAQALSDRLKKESGDDLTKQVTLAFKLATSRPPTEIEIRRSLELMDQLQKKDGATLEQSRRYFCLMLVNLNEFVYLN